MTAAFRLSSRLMIFFILICTASSVCHFIADIIAEQLVNIGIAVLRADRLQFSICEAV